MSAKEDLVFSAYKISEALDGSMMVAARTLRDIKDRSPKELATVARRSNISLRKAYALARIAEVFDKSNISDQRLEQIGWAKLDLLSTQLTKEPQRLDELVTYAETSSQQALKAHLQGETQDGGNASMLLHLPKDADKRFREVLEAFGAEKQGKGLANKEQALIRLLEAVDRAGLLNTTPRQ